MIDERAKINVQLNYSISWKRKLNGNYLCLAPEDFTVVTVMLGVIDRLNSLRRDSGGTPAYLVEQFGVKMKLCTYTACDK